MTLLSDEKTLRVLREVLARTSMPPATADLWPRVRQRIAAGSAPPSPVEWVLIAAVAATWVIWPSVALLPVFYF
jgi:hypothetical protein